MDPINISQFDSNVEKFADEWERASQGKAYESVRLAMMHHMVKDLYRSMREGSGRRSHLSMMRDPLGRFRTVGSIGRHALYYIAWIVKWFAVFPFMRRKKIILASVIPGRALSDRYMKLMRAWAASAGASIVHFSITYDRASLFSRDVFCYPHMLYKCLPADEQPAYDAFEGEYRELIRGHFPSFPPMMRMRALWKTYAKMSVSFDRLLHTTLRDAKILCLAQDLDNVAERIIFALRCRRESIPTVCFNHAVPIYTHLLKNSYSDAAIVWGGQQKERIEALSIHQPRHIYLSGRPLPGLRTDDAPSAPGRRWLYIMQAYKDPLQDRATRDLEYTMSVLRALSARLAGTNDGARLLVRHHPLDLFTGFPENVEVATGDIARILPSVELIFTEDSTLSIELLATSIPIVYVADSAGAVHIDYERWGAGHHLLDPDAAGEVIANAMTSPVSHESRQRMHDYYFGGPFAFPELSGILGDL